MGQTVVSGPDAPIEIGNAMPLSSVPLGSAVHCVELYAGRGGQMVRTGVEHIRMTGRNAQGVKLINLHGDDRLLAIAPVISEDDEGTPAE